MKIVSKEILSGQGSKKIVRLRIEAPLIAKKIKPGQFIVVMVVDNGERVPLTVADKDANTIDIIVQQAGVTTTLLGELKRGDSLYAVAGPLGKATSICNYGHVLCIAGGVGIAEIYPVAKSLKKSGNKITTILGVKTKESLILEKELRAVSDEFYLTTEDGSYGQKGFPTDLMKSLLNGKGLVYTVGPVPLMKNVSLIAEKSGINTLVSLNALMVDGTGMCGSCRVTVGKETKFACVDGPEFNGHLVDWDELEKRNRVYQDKEKKVCALYNIDL